MPNILLLRTFVPGVSSHALSHPEIELRPSLFTTSKLETPTILDLLEIFPDHVNWKEKLDHSALLNHFRVSESHVISHI
jgi:hypothetical protein